MSMRLSGVIGTARFESHCRSTGVVASPAFTVVPGARDAAFSNQSWRPATISARKPLIPGMADPSAKDDHTATELPALVREWVARLEADATQLVATRIDTHGFPERRLSSIGVAQLEQHGTVVRGSVGLSPERACPRAGMRPARPSYLPPVASAEAWVFLARPEGPQRAVQTLPVERVEELSRLLRVA